jgi:hypothetical protein
MEKNQVLDLILCWPIFSSCVFSISVLSDFSRVLGSLQTWSASVPCSSVLSCPRMVGLVPVDFVCQSVWGFSLLQS